MQHRRLLLPAVLLAVAGPALADTVLLKDGRKFTNVKVTERADGRYEIEGKGAKGALIVDRLDVTSIDREADPKAGAAGELDTVYLVDNRVLQGRATFSDDAKELILSNAKGAESRFPRELVKSIRYGKDRTPPPQPGTNTVAPVTTEDETEKRWKTQIDASIAKLKDPTSDRKERKKARDEILELGVFALNYVKAEIAKIDSGDVVVRPILEEVLKIADMKSVVAAKVEETIPGICEKLIDPDPAERVKAVCRVALDCPNDAAPLLLHLIKTDQAAKVKSICVGQLSMLKRYDELAQVLKMHEHGQWRLVAALELGDAGIYIGVPVLIETLKLDGAQFKDVRTIAIEKLKAWTHQGNLGYLPDADDKTEREAAVARWEAWWSSEGLAWAEKNSRAEGASVSDQDKQRALDLWRDANKVLVELQTKQDNAAKDGKTLEPRDVSYSYETAAFIFKQAYDLDPSLSSARLSRAIILYEQLGRPREAEGELKLIVTRFAPENAKLLRSLATTHLARLAELETAWARAESYWVEVRTLEPDNLDAHIGIGDSYLERALSAARPVEPKEGEGKPNPDAPKRSKEDIRLECEGYIGKAIQAYKAGLEAVERKQKALRDSVTDLGPGSGEVEDYKTGRLLMRIREDRDSLVKRAASIWFRLGRAESARPTGGKDALAAFKAARNLDPKDERYSKAAALWEKITGEGTEK